MGETLLYPYRAENITQKEEKVMPKGIDGPKDFIGQVVVCRHCSFIYSANHEWDCPVCKEAELIEENKRLREAGKEALKKLQRQRKDEQNSRVLCKERIPESREEYLLRKALEGGGE